MINSRLFFCILLFLCSSVMVSSYDDVQIKLMSQDDSSLDGFAVHYRLVSVSGFMINGSSVVVNSSFLINGVEQGDYSLFVELDNSASSFSDFYGSFPISVKEDSFASGFVFPIGSLSLSIADAKGKPVRGALVKVDCSKKHGVQGYFKSDELGALYLNYLPVSVCDVRSAVGDEVKRNVVNISRGSSTQINLVFENYDASSNSFFVLLFVLVLIFVAVVLISGFYFFSVKMSLKKINNKEHDDGSSENAFSAVVQKSSKEDILVALNESERKVVVFLLDEQKKFSGDDFFVNQAKIIYGAGVPKTTLVRLLSSLEKKNILEVEKIGKAKRVRFTHWFNKK